MSFPHNWARKTNHTKPRYQLYQPGFNRHNSCWIDGGWVDVPKEEWAKRKASVEKLAGRVRKYEKAQHHSGKGTPVAKMTREQKTAFDFCSGVQMLECRTTDENPHSVAVSLEMEGCKPSERSLQYLRKNKLVIPTHVVMGGKNLHQTRGLDIPKDVLVREVFDFWRKVVAQNKARSRGMFDEAVESLAKKSTPGTFNDFFGGFAWTELFEIQEYIVRHEYHLKRTGKSDWLDTYDEDLKTHAEMWDALNKVLKNKFAETYEAQRRQHNECPRINLDNSKGHLFCWVLPKFNRDGTHEPWGDRDVPWAAEFNSAI